MPWPDSTELSFGYCFLRELESQYTHGGRFPKAPDFISQYDEKTKGYDVEVATDNAVPLFIQLKRSKVMTHSHAGEFSSPHFSVPPVYRMHLHPNGQYAQHSALQALESAGNEVIYATSQIGDPQELARHSARGTVVAEASAIFSPGDIQLPDLTSDHHVSFRADQAWAVVFSNEGKRFKRKWPDASKWRATVLEKPRSRVANMEAMRTITTNLRNRFYWSPPDRRAGAIVEDPSLAENPAVEASLMAYYLLGAQLTFVKPHPGNE